MTDEDGHRIEAAEQYGFRECEAVAGNFYYCYKPQLIAFAKACERAGRAQAARLARERIGSTANDSRDAALWEVADELERMNNAADVELNAAKMRP